MTTIADLREDANVAFGDLLAGSTDVTEQRRATRAFLGALYEAREAVRAEFKDGYPTEVKSSLDYKITQGVIAIRGRLTHGPLNDIRPNMRLAFPGPKFFLSQFTYPGENLTWLEIDELPESDQELLAKHDPKHYYAAHVGGYMVLPTLDIARRFLSALALPLLQQ